MSRGSYSERTRLAWRRTVLLAALASLLLIRLAVERNLIWVGVAGGVAWLVVAVAGQRRIRVLAADDRAPLGAALTLAVSVALVFATIGAVAALAT